MWPGAADDNVDYQTLPDFYDSEADEQVSNLTRHPTRALASLAMTREYSTTDGSVSLRVAVGCVGPCVVFARCKTLTVAMSEQDEEWVRKQRKGRSTDAILSCPACMETVSIECQRCARRTFTVATVAEP
jgi:hypothetical protein